MKQTILVLGSGALKIGEAGEFDYSGTQAIKALREEGVRIVLVNPNIATIQTSPDLTDATYLIPVTVPFVARVIAKEKPNGILLSFGGQTALNCGLDLHRQGILTRHKIAVLGTPIDAIVTTEDRGKFAKFLGSNGFPTTAGRVVKSAEEGMRKAKRIGLPVMVRASFALGGKGSGIADDEAALKSLLDRVFGAASQVIIEESLSGWKEIEYEIIRDFQDNCIAVCNMENLDPMGIHTGESIVIAPSQTLTNDEYFHLRQLAFSIVRRLKIVGECNIQFALHPQTGAIRVVEINARLSRSSALASKATGYPIAYVAAKLALGKILSEIPNAVTKKTTAFFEPALDYIVVKIPRWDMEKFLHVDWTIGSEMKSVGEVMAIGRTFSEAIQKAVRSLNIGKDGVTDYPCMSSKSENIIKRLHQTNIERLFTICEALEAGIDQTTIREITSIDPWFIASLFSVINIKKQLARCRTLGPNILGQAKRFGFSDKQIGALVKVTEDQVRRKRQKYRIIPAVRAIDTTAGEFPAYTNYLYCTYHGTDDDLVSSVSKKRAIVLGSGPYAIGSSVEFDWCAVNAVLALRKHGYQTVVVNCNPETVSTDYDYSDALYFEELTLERVLDIYEIEHAPILLSVGGQIPNSLAPHLATHHVPILGSAPADIITAEVRKTFHTLLDRLKIPQPPWGEVKTRAQAQVVASKIGYPVIVRPSFVLSGRAMEILFSADELDVYLRDRSHSAHGHALVLSHFFAGAVECDLDAVAVKGKVDIMAFSEHIEHGGVHSGDSTMIQPSETLADQTRTAMQAIVHTIARQLHICGPFNVQFLISDGIPYVIECNLRASRSIPFVSKTLNINFIERAIDGIVDKTLPNIRIAIPPYRVVKAPYFSFQRLRGADPAVGIEMTSTGEVAAFGRDSHEALLLAYLATGMNFPHKKAILVSLGGRISKLRFLQSARELVSHGFTIYATSGSSLFLRENTIAAISTGKLHEGIIPNVEDLFSAKRIDFAVVTPEFVGKRTRSEQLMKKTEGYRMRRLSADRGIPVFSNIETANVFITAVLRYPEDALRLFPMQWYYLKNHP